MKATKASITFWIYCIRDVLFEDFLLHQGIFKLKITSLTDSFNIIFSLFKRRLKRLCVSIFFPYWQSLKKGWKGSVLVYFSPTHRVPFTVLHHLQSLKKGWKWKGSVLVYFSPTHRVPITVLHHLQSLKKGWKGSVSGYFKIHSLTEFFMHHL